MKLSISPKHNRGIGLIEVMVTAVVIAVGLLAVGSLHGNLIGNSRTNKTRAEAKALADTKIEELRDTIVKSGANSFDNLTSSTSGQSIGGVNETFNRSWVITNQTDPARKQVSVTVCWPSSSCTDSVTVQSVLAFDALGNSALAGQAPDPSGTALNGPSTNAESSDEITETIDLPPSNTPYAANTIVTINGKTYIVQDSLTKAIRADLCSSLSLTAFENNLFTRRVDFDGVSGNEAIELYELAVVGGVNYCIPRIRYNGGVIIPIRGIVHSGVYAGNGNNQNLLDVTLFTFNASETGAFCVFKPTTGAKSAPYVCYVGGNCSNFSGTTSTAVTECPGSISAAKVGPGGWRGKVGLLGVAGTSSSFKNVCFSEEIAGTPATLDTARNYYARRNGLNEGINKPYSCHDFLIIGGQNTNGAVSTECIAQANAIGGINLASKTIQRDITSGNNVYDPIIDTSFCSSSGTSYTITGTIANVIAPAVPLVTVSDSVTTQNCTTTNTSYACSITTSASSLTFTGTYNSETVNCTLSPISSSGCALTFTASANPIYTITGNITGTSTAANAVTLTMSNGGSCINNMNGTYSCSITTAATSATLTAASSAGGTVTPSTAQNITLPGSSQTITGPNFAATALNTISGSISIANHVDNLTTITVAVDTGFGTCTLTGTHAEQTSDSYSCTVPTGANHLSIAISPTCSSGGGSKKYEITDGTTTTNTGSFVINFSNITGNVTKNISVTKSNSNC